MINSPHLLFISCMMISVNCGGPGIAQWWLRSLPTSETPVRFLDQASDAGWVCCWFSFLLWGFSPGSSFFLPSQNSTLLRLRSIFCNCSLRSGKFFQSVTVFAMLFSTFSPDLSKHGRAPLYQSTGNGWRKSHVILSIFMQPGPGLYGRLYNVLNRKKLRESVNRGSQWGLAFTANG